VPSFGGFGAWTLSSISATQCIQTECIWSLCAGLEGDSLFFKIETCNARSVRLLPHPPIRCPTSNTPIICTYFRVMRRANEELHVTLKKARKEVRSTRSKLGEVVMKQEEKCKKAIERVKVSKHYCLLLIFHLFN
jgi:hypothetical protein